MKADHVLAVGWLIIAAYVRGYDYLFGDDTWAAKDFMLAAFPEWFWGIAFLLGGVILAVGVLRRRHLLVWLGHGWLCVAYGVAALAQAFVSGPFWLVVALLAGVGTVAYTGVRWGGWPTLGVSLVLVPAWSALSLWTGETLDGIRGVGALGLVAIVHGIYHLRTGISPLRPSGTQPVETIGKAEA